MSTCVDSQLAPIPAIFPGTADYTRGFIWFVAEEVRAQLQQALQGLDSSSCVQVTSLEPRRHLFDDSGVTHDKNLHELVASIPVSSSSSSSSSGGGALGGRQQAWLPFKPTDLLLLSTKQVRGVEDLQQPYCSPWMLALVTSTPDQQQLSAAAAAAGPDSAGSSSWEVDIKVNVFAVSGSPEHDALLSSSSSWWAYGLNSLATAKRAFDALQQLASQSDEATISPILQQVLQPVPQPDCRAASSTYSSSFDTAIVSYCQQGSPLNPSQQKVLLHVASSTINSSSTSQPTASAHISSPISLVQGPPGTGKTATLTKLLSLLGCSGSRVLACAPTNVAVCQLAARYLQLLGSAGQFAASGEPSTSSSSSSGSTASRAGLSLLGPGDVLLVGTEERLDLSDSLLGVFLPARVQRLMAVAGPTGLLDTLGQLKHTLSARLYAEWRQHSMQQGLLPPADCSGGSGSGKGPLHSDTAVAFEEFLQRRLVRLQAQLQQQLQVVQSDLPQQLAGARGLQARMQQLLMLLQQFLGLLQQHGHDDKRHSGHGSVLAAYAGLAADHGPSAGLNLLTGRSPSPQQQQQQQQQQPDSSWLEIAVQLLQVSTAAQGVVPNILRQRPNAYTLQQFCLRSCRHVFCTVAAVGSGVMSGAGSFAVAVVDEASQLVEAEAAILLARTCCPQDDSSSLEETTSKQLLQHLVLVGDPKQLPATVISQRAAQLGYSRSLFERLQQQGHMVMLLDVQYRCRPEISLWPRRQFYDGQLQDGPNVCDPGYGTDLFSSSGSSGGAADGSQLLAPFLMIDVPGSFEERGNSTGSTDTSISNPMEVDVVMWLLKMLKQQAAAAGLDELSVGVITPYRRQVDTILQQCSPSTGATGSNSSSSSSSSSVEAGCLRIDVRSVDGFQGSERDVIILSAVRANGQRVIGFLADPRRLNVAVTRARFALVVVCNAHTVAVDPNWASLLRSAKQRGLLRVLDASAAAGGDKLLVSLHKRLQQRQWQQQLIKGSAQLFSTDLCPWQVTLFRGCRKHLARHTAPLSTLPFVTC